MTERLPRQLCPLVLIPLLAAPVACFGGDGTGAGGGAGGGAGSGESCPEGTETCPCYPNATCNGELTCASGFCVSAGGAGGEQAPQGGASTPVGGNAGTPPVMTGGAEPPPTGGAAPAGVPATGGMGAGTGGVGGGVPTCTEGDAGCACFPNQTCNAGLVCQGGLCVAAPTNGGTGGTIPVLSDDQRRCLDSYAADECQRCGCMNCTQQMLDCHESGDTVRDAACASVLTCGTTNDCAGTDCYCGIADLITCITAPAGPCITEIRAAAGTEDTIMISSQQLDVATALGRANAAAECGISACAGVCP